MGTNLLSPDGSSSPPTPGR